MPGEPTDERTELRADCARCAGLCCVALPFARSADFAVDKRAGMPCVHLRADDRCDIHDRLRSSGFPGCEVFDCFGAGQQVVQHTFAGESWRSGGRVAADVFSAFVVLQAVHEMRWYLADPALGGLPAALLTEVAATAERLRRLSFESGPQLQRVDVARLRAEVGALLERVSADRRAGLGGDELRRLDLSGRRMRSLRGSDLRGSLLLGSDLRRADLRRADLLGADLRGADLRGADLSDALFVTQPQLAAAMGDSATRIPESLVAPRHWRQKARSTPAAERR